MPPVFIRSLAALEATVKLRSTTESLFLDFKRTIDWRPVPQVPQRQGLIREAQKETCRDIAQFANADGGCLLIGIDEEPDPTTKLKVAVALSPIADPEQMKQWIEQAIRNYLVPATFSHDVVIVSTSAGSVIAVNIPPNRHLVSLWDQDGHTVEYLFRTSHGKEWMNPDEAQRHMMTTSRAARLAVETARNKARSTDVEIAGGFWLQRQSSSMVEQRWRPPDPITFGAIDGDWFELKVPTSPEMAVVTIPYGFVDEAWVDASGRVNMLLSVRVVVSTSGVFLEPMR